MCINYTSYVQAFLCQFCFAASSGLASTNPFPDTLAGFFLGLLWPFDATFPFSAAEGPSSVHKGCPKLKQMRLGAIACGLNSSNQMQKHVSMHHNHASCMLMTTLTSSSQAACTSLQSYDMLQIQSEMSNITRPDSFTGVQVLRYIPSSAE